MTCCNTYCCRRRALDAARVSGIMLIQYPNGRLYGYLAGREREQTKDTIPMVTFYAGDGN